jgi:protoheme IX farnesyltransferase
MARGEALTFGIILSVLSVMTLGLATNWLAAGLLAFTIFFYAVIYTMWLKRATPQNIVIGGAAGAFPPAIGWAAVTGSVGVEALVMFLIIFLWTPPHFWALALYKRGDYDVAGIPMLPNVAGDRATQIQIFVYSLLLAAAAMLPVLTGFAGAIYGTVALITGLAFILMAWRLYRASEADLHRAARQLFTYSLSYLFVVFLALFTDSVFALLGGL